MPAAGPSVTAAQAKVSTKAAATPTGKRQEPPSLKRQRGTPASDRSSGKRMRSGPPSATYKEAAVAVRMAITHINYPDRGLDEAGFDKIKTALIQRIDDQPEEAYTPNLFAFRLTAGVIRVDCANSDSKKWLEENISLLPSLTSQGLSTTLCSQLFQTQPLTGALSHV